MIAFRVLGTFYMIPNFYVLRGFVRVICHVVFVYIFLFKQWLIGFYGSFRWVFYLLSGTKNPLDVERIEWA